MSIDNIAATITSVAGSFVASMIATDALYSISNQIEIWIVLVAVVYIYLVVIGYALQAVFKRDARGENTPANQDAEIVMRTIRFLQMSTIFVGVRLATDGLRAELAVTEMDWADYYIFFVLFIFAIFVLSYKLQHIFRVEKERKDKD